MATLARLPPGARGVVLGRSLKGAPAGISNRAAARILARAPAGAPRNPRNGAFRQAVMSVLKPFAETVLTKGQKPGEPDVYGAAEGSDLYSSIVSASTATAGRQQTALDVLEGRTGKDSVWTSCIAFLTGVLGKAAAASGGTIPKMGGSDAEVQASRIPGAWHPGSEVDANSPLPGDMYVFHYLKTHHTRPGYFSHTGLVWAVEKQDVARRLTAYRGSRRIGACAASTTQPPSRRTRLGSPRDPLPPASRPFSARLATPEWPGCSAPRAAPRRCGG